MVKTTLFCGSSQLIALTCAAEQDLGNICRRFYNDFRAPDRCSYATLCRAPRLQMLLELTPKMPTPRPCRIHAVNGGWHLPMRESQDNTCRRYPNTDNVYVSRGKALDSCQTYPYYYDFAVVGECGNVGACLDVFMKQMSLCEIKNSYSGMSEDELRLIMKRW
jgi:hypothetical protein